MADAEECELTKYAPYKYIPFFDEQGRLRYRPSLCWARLEPDGRIVADVDDEPKDGDVFPPFEEIDGNYVCRVWLDKMDKFILYPNYTIEELGSNWVLVTRSDGVRIKRICWLSKAILLELSNYPEGVRLDEFLPLIIARMAEHKPDFFEGDMDRKIAEAADIAIIDIEVLAAELGLIKVEKL